MNGDQRLVAGADVYKGYSPRPTQNKIETASGSVSISHSEKFDREDVLDALALLLRTEL